MRRCALALVVLAACEPPPLKPPPMPPPVDECAGLPAIGVTLTPSRVRVNGSATIVASGGSGRFIYALSTNGSGGKVSGSRYQAGPSVGHDVLTVSDDCTNISVLPVNVLASFDVVPSSATVRPGTHFVLQVNGMAGAARFSTTGPLASGGSVSETGEYTAGMSEGLDLIVAQDSVTGDQVLAQYTVSNDGAARGQPGHLALPSGASVPLKTVNGSGVVTWAVADGGVGSVAGDRYVAPALGGGDAVVVGTDAFTQETVSVSVRVLTELTRPNRAQGRRSDVAAMASGDFDGDGFVDLAVGVSENDLARPQGGAVFIYRGLSPGLSATPDWQILPDTDTAQLGAVLAAGDLDGDGRDDLAVGEPGADITVADSGAVLLYRIGPHGPELIRAPLTGLGRANFGSAITITDVNGDGHPDLVVGSPGADLAATATISSRGVTDVFLLQPGKAFPDTGTLRVGGTDLTADGGMRPFTNLRAARAVVAADLNDDGIVDLAMLTSVNNSFVNGGTPLARNQIAVQLHFGRGGANPFQDLPDAYIVPINTADATEGTWRLGSIPKAGGLPPYLVLTADQADSPNLADAGGTAANVNAGGALLYDLTSLRPTGAPPPTPVQLTRDDAFARIYGDASGIAAGRSFTATDLDGDGKLELILGAPYAGYTQTFDGGSSTFISLAGKLLVYPLAGLTPHALVNRPLTWRGGGARADTLGTAVAEWRITSTTRAIVAHAGRATTALGDFTGRVDAFIGSGDLATWAVQSAPLQSAPASQQLGAAIDLVRTTAGVSALVGSPGISGPALDNSGNEVGAGQALLWSSTAPTAPQVLVEGAATPYFRDAGWPAFGGRTLAADVTVTDFDGDGRKDLVIAAPNFTLPVRTADGGLANASAYALARPECVPFGSQTPGALLVQQGQADGTFKDAFRVWAVRDFPGCDGGTACQRSQVSRNGIAGGFDFNGDGKQDLGATRTNGLEVFAGHALDDGPLSKVSMSCDTLFTLPALTTTTSMVTALGDLDGDGCDEVGARYTDNNARFGIVIAFGFDATGAHCGSHTTPSWIRLSGDAEAGVANMRLGVAMARVGAVVANDTHDYLAVGADAYSYQGVSQSAVLLYDVAQLAARRPAMGEALVGGLNDGLVPIPVVYTERAPSFGRMLWGGVDLTHDGKPDLVVSALGANVNGDGVGAVFVFEAGSVVAGANSPWLTVVADERERASFGQDLSAIASDANGPAVLGIGAPLSYRSGTANGTAYVLPLDF